VAGGHGSRQEAGQGMVSRHVGQQTEERAEDKAADEPAEVRNHIAAGVHADKDEQENGPEQSRATRSPGAA
jgi:hypothetical protein